MADIVGPVIHAGVGGEVEVGNSTMKEHIAMRKAEREADNGEQCLFQRIGGKEVVIKLVAGVYDKMRADANLGPTFNKFASTEGTFQRLKDKTVEYLIGEWGGIAYDGPDMYISHSTFGIPVSMFDGMMFMFRDVLKGLDVNEPEFEEVIKSITKMRGPMCDPGGTFAKEFNDYMENLSRQREERVKYYKKHNIPYSKMTGWALEPEPKAKAKAKAKERVAGAGGVKFTLAEVQEHASAKSLWIIVDKKVYDCSNYLKEHPGGPAILKSVAGKDGSAEFYAAHEPSKPNVKSVMKRLLIGSLEDKPPAGEKTVKDGKSHSASAKKGKGEGLKLETAADPSNSKQVSGEHTDSTTCSSCFEPEFDCPPAELPALAKCTLLHSADFPCEPQSF